MNTSLLGVIIISCMHQYSCRINEHTKFEVPIDSSIPKIGLEAKFKKERVT